MGTIIKISGALYYKRLNKVDSISPTDKPFENIYECFKAFKVKFRVGRTYRSEIFLVRVSILNLPRKKCSI